MANQDTDTRKPVPIRLVQLDQVQKQAIGTKIRFLGCVQTYQAEERTLMLSGKHSSAEKTPIVAVNLEEVLDSVNHELLTIGAWLNIIGYVDHSKQVEKPATSKSQRRSKRASRQNPALIDLPVVDAMMIWSAGAIKLDKYESAVRNYQRAISNG